MQKRASGSKKNDRNAIGIPYSHAETTVNSGGESGIRTRGTLVGYDDLANRCFRPLSHLSDQSSGSFGKNFLQAIRKPINFGLFNTYADLLGRMGQILAYIR